MLNIIKKIHNINNKKYKILIIFLIFLFFIFVRIFLEGKDFFNYNISNYNIYGITQSYFLVVHWLFWYITTFLIVFLGFRYILKINKDKVLYLALGAPILLIPVIYANIIGKNIFLEYLSFHNLIESFKGVLTLFIFDKNNSLFFPEMIVLIIGLFSISYYFSKNIIKSLINTIVIYFSIPILCAFIYFCPANNFCSFSINSSFSLMQFYAFYWLILSLFYFILFYLPEVINYIKGNNKIFNLKYFIIFILFFIIFLLKIFSVTNYYFDIIILSLLFFIIFYLSLFIIKYFKEEKYFNIIIYFLFYNIFAINTILLTIM